MTRYQYAVQTAHRFREKQSLGRNPTLVLWGGEYDEGSMKRYYTLSECTKGKINCTVGDPSGRALLKMSGYSVGEFLWRGERA